MLTQANRRTSGDWDEVLAHAAAIVGTYDTGVTLRQLFYRAAQGGISRNALARTDHRALGGCVGKPLRPGYSPEGGRR
jgi:hypothetical protein